MSFKNIEDITIGAFNNLIRNTGFFNPKKREIIVDRINICKGCDKVYLDESINTLRCGVCKCFIKWKSSNLNEKCPLNKWEDIS